MRISQIIVIGLCVFQASNTCASKPDVIEWFDHNAVSAASFEYPDSFYLEISEFYPNYIPLSDIESQISRVGQDIPNELLQLRAIAEAGGRTVKYRVWYKDETHWRVCQDTTPLDPTLPFTDTGRYGDKLWLLNHNTLHLTDTGSLKHRGKWVDPNFFKNICFYTLYQAIFAIAPPPVVYTPTAPAHFETSSGVYILQASHSSDNVEFVDFAVTPYENTYTISEYNVHRNPEAEEITIGAKATFSDWKTITMINRPVASKRELFDGDRLFCVYELTDFRPLSESDPVSGLARTPTFDESDLIRGQLTYTTVMNHTDNEKLVYASNSDDVSVSRSIQTRNRIRTTDDNKLALNRIGKLFLAGVSLLVVGILIARMKGK